MKSFADYSGQVVIVFGRDAFLPITFGTGLESIVFLPRVVMRAGEGMADSEISEDLKRWGRFQDTVVRLTRPSVVPIVLTPTSPSRHAPEVQ